MLEVIDLQIDELALNWEPDDSFDFEKVIMATVGEEGAGSNYYIHLCTASSIARIDDKSITFIIDQWKGEESLKLKLNEFIRESLENNVKDEPYHQLSKFWSWEYGRRNS